MHGKWCSLNDSTNCRSCVWLLRNSCPCTTYPTFSSPLMEDPISPLTNSSLCRTNTRTHPHSSQTPRSSKQNPVLIIDASSCFTFYVLIRFALPPVLRSTGLHLFPRMFSSLESAAALHSYAAPAHRPVSPFYIVWFSIYLSHWFCEVVAYPEPYLELRFSLRSVLYKVTRPLVCSLASSTQSSLVSSLPRFALRSSRLKSLPSPGTALLGRCDSSWDPP